MGEELENANQYSEPPTVKNRADLTELLESVIDKTYQSEVENQSLETDLFMVKSYIVETHTGVGRLQIPKYSIKINETNDETLHVVEYKKSQEKKPSIMYIDSYDKRFWIIHTMEKSTISDAFISKLIKSESKKDYVWFPSQFMEKFKQYGDSRSISIKYSEMGEKKEETKFGDLSMKLWGSSADGVLQLLRRLPDIRKSIENSTDTSLKSILSVCEGLSYSSPLSGIGIKYVLNSRNQTQKENDDFIIDDIQYTGKFTARGGTSVPAHLKLISDSIDTYSQTLRYLEEEVSIGTRGENDRISGHPLEIILSRRIDDLNQFVNTLINCKSPFRLMGFSKKVSESFIAISGIDLHTGSRLNIEISNGWIRLYLPKGSCGNAITRFYSIIQHYYDSNARLEGVEFGRLF